MRGKAKRGWMALGIGVLAGSLIALTGQPLAGERSLTVAAASDLQFAFAAIGALFERETGAKAIFTFGSTGNLARQIENGAPVDIFAAANVQFVDELAGKGLVITDTQQSYAVGRIVLAGNRRTGVHLIRLKDLLQPEVKRVAIANPQHAPYGMAAKQALESVGLWEALQPKLVYGENVRQALQYVQTGNAEAGIVALSIAEVSEVAYALIEQRLHQPLRQALAVVTGTRDEELARKFIAFINGPQGRPIMKRYGFLLPGEL